MIGVEGGRGARRLVPDGAAEATTFDGNGSCRQGRHSAATSTGSALIRLSRPNENQPIIGACCYKKRHPVE